MRLLIVIRMTPEIAGTEPCLLRILGSCTGRMLQAVVHTYLDLLIAHHKTPQRRSLVGIRPESFSFMSLGTVQRCSVVFSLEYTGKISVELCWPFVSVAVILRATISQA